MSSTTFNPPITSAGAPTKRTAVVLAILSSVLFAGLFLSGGSEISDGASGSEVIDKFTHGSTMVQVWGYGLVITAALLVFWGASIRRLLTATTSWTADVVLGGTIVMGVTLVGWTVTTFALKDAVDSGVPEVAQTVNILDNANFVPAMLGLACTMIAVGVTSLRAGSLPRWLAIGSIVLGAIAPLGPGGFAPFTLFPIWIIVVSALVRSPRDA